MSERSIALGAACLAAAFALGGCAAATRSDGGSGPVDGALDDGGPADGPLDARDERPPPADIVEPYSATLEPELGATPLAAPTGGTASPATRCAMPAAGLAMCGASCGNGALDSCDVCRPCLPSPRPDVQPIDVRTCCMPQPEECDGAPTSTCEALGFRGGMLRCGGACFHDTSGCERCATSSAVASCAAPAAGQSVGSNFGLAANDDTIALAWVAQNSAAPATNTLHLALYSPELALRRSIPCVAAPGAGQASVVATGAGWLVAYDRGEAGRTEVVLQRFDREGNVAGSPQVFAGGFAPKLTRGEGVTLLEYEQQYAGNGIPVAFAVVNDAGSVAAPPRLLFEGTYGLGYESAVWVGDGFLAGARSYNGRVDAAQVVRVERDGRVTSRTRPVGTETEYGQLVWDGSRAALLYGTFAGEAEMRWQWLDRRGAPEAAPSLSVRAALPLFGVAYVTPLSEGSYYFVRGQGSLEGLQVRAAASFAPSAGAAPVGRGGAFSSSDHVRLVTMGTRVVAAWSEGGGDQTALAAAVLRPF